MSDPELGEHMVMGLKQLKMNLEILHKMHVAKGLDTNAPYTTNTADLLKIQYVNQSLEALK